MRSFIAVAGKHGKTSRSNSNQITSYALFGSFSSLGTSELKREGHKVLCDEGIEGNRSINNIKILDDDGSFDSTAVKYIGV